MLISDAVGDRGTYVRSDAMHLYITDLSGTKNVLKLLRRIPLSIIGRGDRSISLLRIGTRRIATKTVSASPTGPPGLLSVAGRGFYACWIQIGCTYQVHREARVLIG